MNSNPDENKSTKLMWPGRRAALRRVLVIALVLFPCTWIVNALLIGNWNLLDDRSAESYRHLREAGTIFLAAVAIVFLLTLLPQSQRFLRWGSSRRVIRRGLIILAWIVTVIALFYGEEDWRGRRAWTKYSDALTAQGAELDFKAFVPKPVPDADNFAATPEIKSWFVRNTNASPPLFSDHWSADNFALANAIMSSSASDLPRHVSDLVAWKMAFAAVRSGDTNSAQIPKSDNSDPTARAEASRAILEALKPIGPRLEELQNASSRPKAYYPIIYDLDNPWGILLPHLADIKGVCLRLDLRACAELSVGQSDRALGDVKLILCMNDSLKTEPFLISYLIRLSTFQLAVHAVWEGLAEHGWSDAQLKELQTLLAHYDFIADMKPPFNGERAAGILTADLLEKGKFTLNELTSDPNPSRGSAANAFGRIMPRGWYDFERLNYLRLYNLQLDGAFDVPSKRVFPDKVAAGSKALEQAFAGRNPFTTILTRHQLLAVVMLPALGNVPKKGALGQVTADQAVIACALERYRLAHGQFPGTLDALAPDFISELPHDVITGAPYKYRRDQGNFLLYSVGWNQTDDGGQVVPKGKPFDFDNGDWVWQYPAK